jgi:hypothetical protein
VKHYLKNKLGDMAVHACGPRYLGGVGSGFKANPEKKAQDPPEKITKAKQG